MIGCNNISGLPVLFSCKRCFRSWEHSRHTFCYRTRHLKWRREMQSFKTKNSPINDMKSSYWWLELLRLNMHQAFTGYAETWFCTHGGVRRMPLDGCHLIHFWGLTRADPQRSDQRLHVRQYVSEASYRGYSEYISRVIKCRSKVLKMSE